MGLNDYLVNDVINIIQYQYYKLDEYYNLMQREVLHILNEYFEILNENDIYYIRRYKKNNS